MRLNLATDLTTRDGTLTKDAKIVNAFVDDGNVFKRPAAQGGVSVGVGTAQGGFGIEGLCFTFYGDTLYPVTQASCESWAPSINYYMGDSVVINCVEYWARSNNIGSQPPSASWSTTYIPPAPISPIITYDIWTDVSAASIIISNSGKTITATDNLIQSDAISGIGQTSGKWYIEVTNSGLSPFDVGIADSLTPSFSYVVGISSTLCSIMGMAVDLDNGFVSFYYDGVFAATQTVLTSNPVYIFATLAQGETLGSFTANFGQDSFVYTAPTGFNSGWYA